MLYKTKFLNISSCVYCFIKNSFAFNFKKEKMNNEKGYSSL